MDEKMVVGLLSDATDFILLQSFLIDSEAHSAFKVNGFQGDFPPEIKQPWCEAGPSPPSNGELRNILVTSWCAQGQLFFTFILLPKRLRYVACMGVITTACG
jgi:hypothetical protein